MRKLARDDRIYIDSTLSNASVPHDGVSSRVTRIVGAGIPGIA